MNEWKEFTLADVAEIIPGYAFKSEHFGNIGMPVVKITDINPPYINLEAAHKVDLAFYNEAKLKKYRLSKGDFAIAMTGAAIGKVGRVLDDAEAILNQRVAKISPFETVNHLFVYYCILGNDFQDFIQNNVDSHSAQENISGTSIGRYPILLPPLPEHRAIAGVLSSLDDKIDLLHRQNKTLEGMAEALWRKMFVEEADPGWEKGKLGDEMDITMGQSPAGSSYNEEGLGMVFFQGRAEFDFRYPKTRLFCTEPKRFAKKFDTMVSVRAPVGDINMAIEDCCIGRGLASVRHKKGQISYTFYKIRSFRDEFDSFEQQGTVFGSIGKDDFNSIETVIPPESIVSKYEELSKPLDDKIFKNTIQIRTLSKMRDTMLPKLMSGEVRVRL